MAHESAGLQHFQAARTVPRSLAFRIEHHAVFVRADAAWAANAAANGDRFAVGGDLQAPAAKRFFGVVRLRQAKRDPNVAVRIRLGTESKLVVVPKSPSIADCVEPIGSTIAIDVCDSAHFGLLSDDERTVAVGEPKDFVETFSKLVEFRFGVFVKHAIGNEDVSAASRDRQ